MKKSRFCHYMLLPSFYIRTFLAFLFLFAFIPAPAYAFSDEDYTETEKAGFAFYKLGQIAPDFDSWIKNMPEYKKIVKPRERAMFLSDVKFRLEQGFNTYVPEFGMITVQAPIIIQGMPAREYKNSSERYLRIYLDAAATSAGFYFPFPVGDEWVAMIPRGMESFDNLPVSQAEYDRIIGGPTPAAANGVKKNGVMEIIMQPVAVDTSTPMELDGVELWLMDSEVASLTFWTRNKRKLVWEYTAPWYVSDTQRGVHDLYGR